MKNNVFAQVLPQEKKENKFEVGGILYYNAGYNMGIPTWLRITKMTDKSVWLEELPSMVVTHDGYGQNGTKRPLLHGTAKQLRGCFRIKTLSNGNKCVKADNYHHAYLWDGLDKDFYTD